MTHELQQLKPPPDIKALKVVQLREELEGRGLDITGRKAELVERLTNAEDLRHLVPHKRVTIPEGIKPVEVTMEMAERLLSLPRVLGSHPERGEGVPITLHSGRFGPYVTMRSEEKEDGKEEKEEPMLVMCSLPKRVSMWDVDVATAVELLHAKMARDAAKRQSTRTRRQERQQAQPKAKAKKKARRLRVGFFVRREVSRSRSSQIAFD